MQLPARGDVPVSGDTWVLAACPNGVAPTGRELPDLVAPGTVVLTLPPIPGKAAAT